MRATTSRSSLPSCKRLWLSSAKDRCPRSRKVERHAKNGLSLKMLLTMVTLTNAMTDAEAVDIAEGESDPQIGSAGGLACGAAWISQERSA